MSEIEYTAPELALASAHPSVSAWSIDHVYADPPAAAMAIEAFLQSPENENHPPTIAGAHFVLGAAYAVMGELNVAEEHLDTAEAIFTEIGDELGLAHVTLRRDLVWHQREEFHHPLATFPALIQVARKHGDGWLEAALLSDLGLINLRMGNPPDGVDSLFAALAIAEQGTDRLQETVIRMNLAGAFIALHDFEVAAVWLSQCIAARKSSRPDGIVFECTQALAECEEQLGHPERALQLLDDALTMAEGLEFPFGMAESSYDQGQTRLRLGRKDDAAIAFKRSIANFQKIDTPISQARIVMCEWWLESIAGEFTEKTYRALVEVAEQGIVAPYIRAFDLHDALSQSAEALGLDREAVFHLRESRRLTKEYWEQIAERQSRVALKRHQLATAERAAEQEREHREELARALDAAEASNDENQRLLAKLRAQSVILEQQATEDALTGIGNRRYFDTHLERELARALQFERPISVSLADIDNFKEINDRNSHRIGDEVLVTVAGILRETLRDSDIFARYGGEEFAFIFPEAESEEASRLAEAVRSAIETHPWSQLASGLSVTLSIGLVTRIGPVNSSQLVSAADSLLYLAKSSGKNQVRHRVVSNDSVDADLLFAGYRPRIWTTVQ